MGGARMSSASWTLWYDEGQARGQSLQDYEKENIQLDDLCSWDEYEEFWQARLQTEASFCELSFPQFANLRMFRPGIGPTWEDPSNAKGGKWVVRIKESHGASTMHLWQKLLEAAFEGEQALHDMHDVCGLVLQFRPKGDMISIWNRNATMDEATISRISAFYHSLLGLERSTIQYQVHKESQMRNSQVGPGRRASHEHDARKRLSHAGHRQSREEDDTIPEAAESEPQATESEPQAGWVMVDSHKNKKVISAENVEPTPLPQPRAQPRENRNAPSDWSSSSWRKGDDSKAMSESSWRKAKQSGPAVNLAPSNPWGSKKDEPADHPAKPNLAPTQPWQNKVQSKAEGLAAWQTPKQNKMSYNTVAAQDSAVKIPAPRPKAAPEPQPAPAPPPELPTSQEAAIEQRFNWAEDSDEEDEPQAELEITEVNEVSNDEHTDHGVSPEVEPEVEPEVQPEPQPEPEEEEEQEEQPAAKSTKPETPEEAAAAAAKRKVDSEEDEWEALQPVQPSANIVMIKQLGVLVLMGLILVGLMFYIGRRRLPIKLTDDEEDDVEFGTEL